MKIILKGGAGSGWFSPPRGTHTGERHRAVGSGTAGRQSARAILKRKRAAIKTPAYDKAEAAIRAWAKTRPSYDPNKEDADVGMMLDVMELNPDRAEYYGQKVGLSAADIQAFVSEAEMVTKEMARADWDVKRSLAYEARSGGTGVWTGLPNEIHDNANQLVGNSWQDAASRLQTDYGVRVDIRSYTPDAIVHKELSRLVNLADSDPRLRHVIGQQLKEVRFGGQRHAGDTATASAGGNHVWYHNNSQEYRSVTTTVHELGHVFHDNLGSGGNWITDGNFGDDRRHVSMYAWQSPLEDFAETFVSVIANNQGARDWIPGKYEYVDAALRERVQ